VKCLEGLEAMYLLRFLEPSNSLIYDGYMPVRLDTVPRDCVICGKKFEAGFDKHIYCSSQCNNRAKTIRNREKRRAERAKEVLKCIVCDVELPSTARRDKKFCSPECSGSARFNTSRASRRLRITVGGEEQLVTRVAIYERDNWVCQLCMKPIDRTLRYPEPMSASLDHIIPLSKGGENSAENFQASHLVCNISVGNRKTQTQLRPAPVWLGVEYCSLSQACDHLGIPNSRLTRFVKEGLVPCLPREKGDNYRIPIDFVEEAYATKTPQELFVDPRVLSQGWGKQKETHRELTCDFCKKTVSVPIDLKSRRKFCSEECYKSSLREKKREANRKNPRRKTPVIRYCIICGSENPVSKDGSHSNALCGKKECKSERNAQLREAKRSSEESHPDCKQCGNAFEQRKRGGGQLRRYCSDECKKQSARDRAKAWHHANKKS